MLSSVETNIIWSIVDYSTMSNDSAMGTRQSGVAMEETVWLDSWIALFGMEHDQDLVRVPL